MLDDYYAKEMMYQNEIEWEGKIKLEFPLKHTNYYINQDLRQMVECTKVCDIIIG